MIARAIATAVALLLAAPAAAQLGIRHPPRGLVEDMPVCSVGSPRLYAVTDGASSTDCEEGGAGTEVLCLCSGGSWTVVTGGGGADTTCLDAGVDCLFAASASEGGAATTAAALAADPVACGAGSVVTDLDADGTLTCAADDDTPESGDFGAAADLDATGALLDDSVGLGELAACSGADEIVEYGASGVPSCIATPGGGGVTGPGSSTDEAVARWDGTSGDTLQDGAGLTISDAGLVTVTTGDLVVPDGTSTDPTLRGADVDSGFCFSCFGQAGHLGFISNGTWVFLTRASPSGLTVNGGVYVGVGASVGFTSGVGMVFTSSTQIKIRVGTTDAIVLTETAGVATTTINGAAANEAKARTCSDSGDGSPGTLVLSVAGASYAELTNADADGCAVTLSEISAVEGQRLEVVLVSNAGGTSDWADTATVQETGAGCSLSV